MSSSYPKKTYNNPIIKWIEHRLPIISFIDESVGSGYPTPKNLNYWWNFGSLAGIVLGIMIATGIVLAMFYTANTDLAFESVERIMRDVNYGWLIRYVHMNGGSMFFLLVYIHIFRGMYYGSYKEPRELLWIIGIFILLAMMATAFMGYVLPWGQMSFWGATVITSLFSAIPVVGDSIVQLLWGGFSVDNPTLNRFFALHYLMPFVIVALVFLHLWALHVHKSNNPVGVDIKDEAQDTIPFHPYFTIKDLFGLGVFMIFFMAFVFFAPNFFGEPDNYIKANPMVTPAEIVPEWYFLPYYAILRAFTKDFILYWPVAWLMTAKLAGVLAMFASLLLLAFLPWLDGSKVRSSNYRPLNAMFFVLFIADALLLGYIGGKPASGIYIPLGQAATAYYFFHLLIIVPLVSRLEKPRPVPASIHEAVTKAGKAMVMVIVLGGALMIAVPANAEEDAKLEKQEWSFSGPFGTYDKGQLQRGLQVYKEVCAACHSLNLVSYRNLAEIGLSFDEIKAMAAEQEVQDGPDDEGEMFMRPARPSDRFVAPFPNDNAAKASNGGALPPDLSLMAKARKGGPDYLFSLLIGFEEEAPEGKTILEGLSYNKVFPGNAIAMAPPLDEDSVEYADGTKATLEQEARDVTAFLNWAAEPELEQRKNLGIKVLLFLLVLTMLLYALKRKIWQDLH